MFYKLLLITLLAIPCWASQDASNTSKSIDMYLDGESKSDFAGLRKFNIVLSQLSDEQIINLMEEFPNRDRYFQTMPCWQYAEMLAYEACNKRLVSHDIQCRYFGLNSRRCEDRGRYPYANETLERWVERHKAFQGDYVLHKNPENQSWSNQHWAAKDIDSGSSNLELHLDKEIRSDFMRLRKFNSILKLLDDEVIIALIRELPYRNESGEKFQCAEYVNMLAYAACNKRLVSHDIQCRYLGLSPQEYLVRNYNETLEDWRERNEKRLKAKAEADKLMPIMPVVQPNNPQVIADNGIPQWIKTSVPTAIIVVGAYLIIDWYKNKAEKRKENHKNIEQK